MAAVSPAPSATPPIPADLSRSPERSAGLLGAIWRGCVALFVAYHLVGVTLAALPAPEGGMDRGAWGDPTVQAEFREWTTKLDALGFHLTTPELENVLWKLGSSYMDLRGQVLRPWSAYFDWAGTLQSWRMFVAPHRFPSRLVIDVQEGGAWRTVFSERSDSARWNAPILGDYRFRSVVFRVSWPAYQGQFHDLALWVATQAARDFPQAQKVSVQLQRAETPTAAEARAGHFPPVSVGPQEVIDLGPLR